MLKLAVTNDSQHVALYWSRETSCKCKTNTTATNHPVIHICTRWTRL